MNSLGSAAITPTPMQNALIIRLEHELVAPCCFSHVVADHMSSEAAEMRYEIVQQVQSGRAEKQILDGYVARYGRVILATPDGVAGKIAFIIPPLIGLMSLAIVVLLLRRWTRARQRTVPAIAPMTSAPPEILERIRAELNFL